MYFGGIYAEPMTKDALCKGLSALFAGNTELKSSDKKFFLNMLMTYDSDDVLNYLNKHMHSLLSVGGPCYNFITNACMSDTDRTKVPALPVLWEKPVVRIVSKSHCCGHYCTYVSTYMDIEGNVFHANEYYWFDHLLDFVPKNLVDDLLKADDVALFEKWVSNKMGACLCWQDVVDQPRELPVVVDSNADDKRDRDDRIVLLVARTLSEHGYYLFDSLLDPLPSYLKKDRFDF